MVSDNFKFKRGFKTESENKAESFRKALNIIPHEPLPAISLADYLGLSIFTPSDIFKECSEALFELNLSNEWSALTLPCQSGKSIIIHNGRHSKPRQESNLMHELAHNICGHMTSNQSTLNGIDLLLREYNEEQEKEAEWLGGCLQLPRKALLWAINQKMNEREIAEYYNASLVMVKFRLNITGVKYQVNNWNSKNFKKC